MMEIVGIDPGTLDSSSQYSIHWTSLTQDAEIIILVPFHTAFLLKEKKSNVMGFEPGTSCTLATDSLGECHTFFGPHFLLL